MGRIESVHRASATDAVEYLDPSHPELKAFLRDEFGAAEDPAASLGLLRVLEEVLGLFLAKGLLNVDELSHDAQVAWSSVLEARSPPNASRFSASGFVEIIDDSAFGSLANSRLQEHDVK
jgi:hypothetical protein